RDRLQASISGADRGTSRAKKRLDRAIQSLTAKGDKNPGRIKATELALAQATAALGDGEAGLGQPKGDRDTLSDARERRGPADSKLQELRGMLEKARMAERLTAEKTAAQERFERYRTAVQVSDEISGMEERHPSIIPLPTLREIVGKLRATDARIRQITTELA